MSADRQPDIVRQETTMPRSICRFAAMILAIAVIGACSDAGTGTTATTTSAPEAVATTSTRPATTTPTLAVAHVVDGDTIDLTNGTTVRLIGIDTPERGQCGYDEAAAHLAQIVDGQTVTLIAGGGEDKDRYGRLLRYIDAGGIDVGLSQIEAGLAVARYDSRDGYGAHDREAAYITTDADSPDPCSTATTTTAPDTTAPAAVSFGSCDDARAAGAAPLHRGDPGYSTDLDRDGDGVACE